MPVRVWFLISATRCVAEPDDFVTRSWKVGLEARKWTTNVLSSDTESEDPGEENE